MEHLSNDQNLEPVEILLERSAVHKLRGYASREDVTVEELVRSIVHRVLNGDRPPLKAHASAGDADAGTERGDASPRDEHTRDAPMDDEFVHAKRPDGDAEVDARPFSTPGTEEDGSPEDDRRSKASSKEGTSVLDELRETVDRLSSLEREDASTRSETDLRARITRRIQKLKAKHASDTDEDKPPSMFDLAP